MSTLRSRLDEIEDAVNINAKLNQTIKNKEEKIESLEARLVRALKREFLEIKKGSGTELEIEVRCGTGLEIEVGCGTGLEIKAGCEIQTLNISYNAVLKTFD